MQFQKTERVVGWRGSRRKTGEEGNKNILLVFITIFFFVIFSGLWRINLFDTRIKETDMDL